MGWPLPATVLAASRLHARRARVRTPAAHGHGSGLRVLSAGAAAAVARAAAPVGPDCGGVRGGCGRADPGAQPRLAAAVLHAGRRPGRRDRLRGGPQALAAGAQGCAGSHRGRRGAAGRGAAAADDAVRRALQPPADVDRPGARSLALSGQPGLHGRRQRDGLPGEHANLLGAELRYAARGGRHRPLVQLSVRRRYDRDRAAVVRHRGRRAVAPRPPAADGRARRSRCSTCSAATRRSMRWRSTTCRGSTCSAGRWTARSCSWPCWPCSPATCWPTTCGKGCRGRRCGAWPLSLPVRSR